MATTVQKHLSSAKYSCSFFIIDRDSVQLSVDDVDEILKLKLYFDILLSSRSKNITKV